ncbi:caM kinase-like vesicle-associated protein [Pristis pectinata]|uniref:caM kinase-like vesicle-associated protein n=1 Tax=Pristis pectinata TaxID=685728 RepID=UPI00223CF8CD|nr:caM kinase-like vesicle-associated protein [Pristis pectinata]XP_051865057.1 caM kinase-like vesicle-associated protein [Pristis pectinata]
MTFSCLTRPTGRSYNSLSDITDKYSIGQQLKAKEFCEICLARERVSDRLFICKKFQKKDGRKVRRAAKNEIVILKMVNHPNILQLIDTFETREEYFIIQELATGGDLFDWILEQGSYTERHASNVIRQLLETVSYLHSLRIVHRNIKLENVMYHGEKNPSKVVIGDFHLSRFETGPLTDPCGTPEYLAPEVVARHRYGRPVDLWAIGVIMYILLSGNPPFYDDTDEEENESHDRAIFRKILAGDFELDSPHWEDISTSAKELVCRLLEVGQEDRITAPQALAHTWISGNAALERNLKLGVCTQMEKNFVKAKWKKAIHATTMMCRLRSLDQSSPHRADPTPQVPEKMDGTPAGIIGTTRDPPSPLPLPGEQGDPAGLGHGEGGDSGREHGKRTERP